ncbi:sterol desaturase family protein [Agarilytica rhodophyticola]|uniref:sterol desaturase family protein n=1 Tax=Agarilytica rhodophyticola TaxID=1737490 RepID=UPI000B34488C|nr:sterol desaturase family protein [Agarilytica rhodophyticola]
MEELLFRYHDYFYYFFIGMASVMLLIELYRKKFNLRIVLELFTNIMTYIPFFIMEGGCLYLLYEAQWVLIDVLNIYWVFEINFWSVALSIVVADFVFYWGHRLSHEIPILWACHAAHHSSRNFNFLIYYRSNFMEPIFNILLLLPLVLLGFPPILLIFGSGIVWAYQPWVHTELFGKLGFLEKFLVTPSNHRVHHGSNKHYMDTNYGGLLCIWDRLYGTCQEENEKPIYGIPSGFDSLNPIKVTFSEFPALIYKVKEAKNVREAMTCLFKRRVLNK